ncbi:hypothetical protein [Pseudochryseolinea flava]|uniref:Uncharacterized protein n=1 Tax=Pseudochryseolinea flava TaxID=2059302 RepID=A0A364XZV2_9BACT|nr:hypothetical protein [Pseudochryseolinea flava]RAV99860.1 hypothetical protein DQQ10_17625 [Pseudochryseolinea flava]
MEHNIERLLQEKILKEEHRPIAWRKEATWERIAGGAARKDRSSYYYAAASVAIVLVVASGAFWQWSSQSETAATAKNENSKSIAPAVKLEEAQPVTRAESLTPPSENVLLEIPIDQKVIAAPVEATSKDSVVIETFTTMQDDITLATVTSTAPQAIEEEPKQKVRPIIGVVIEDTPEPMMMTKKKNSKIKFFYHDKDSPLLNNPEPTSLTARIN